MSLPAGWKPALPGRRRPRPELHAQSGPALDTGDDAPRTRGSGCFLPGRKGALADVPPGNGGGRPGARFPAGGEPGRLLPGHRPASGGVLPRPAGSVLSPMEATDPIYSTDRRIICVYGSMKTFDIEILD